jgi:hypothetical protein
MALLDQAMTHYAQDNLVFKLAVVLYELGDVLIRMGRLNEAQEVVPRLEALADLHNSPSHRAYAQRLRAELTRRCAPLNWCARHWHTGCRAQAPVTASAGSRVDESYAL